MAYSVPVFAADKYGNIVPVLPVTYGQSTVRAVADGSAFAAAQVHTSKEPTQMVRVWAIGCDMLYVFGGSGVAAPTEADAWLPAGFFMDIPLTPSQTHVRAAGVGGTGTMRVELLGALGA
jgi:hypothetical protein